MTLLCLVNLANFLMFQHSRKKSVRAVFLITDGYSNGGDPRPAAELLKSLNVHIFTFGIRNGNVKELRDMASNPKDEHSYILDSFQEFEALARRALHEGIYHPFTGEKTLFSGNSREETLNSINIDLWP